MLRIQPLSLKYLSQANSLLDSIFQEGPVPASFFINASLDKHDLFKLNKHFPNIESVEFLLSVDTDINKVIGTIGIFKDLTDGKNILWLTHLCVLDSRRKQGIAKKLLESSIHKSRGKNIDYLRLKSKPFSLFQKLGFESQAGFLQKNFK